MQITLLKFSDLTKNHMLERHIYMLLVISLMIVWMYVSICGVHPSKEGNSWRIEFERLENGPLAASNPSLCWSGIKSWVFKALLSGFIYLFNHKICCKVLFCLLSFSLNGWMFPFPFCSLINNNSICHQNFYKKYI